MASATRKQNVRKRDRKSGAKSGPRPSAGKAIVTAVTKTVRDEVVVGENRSSKGRPAAVAAPEIPSENRVPPALPVPIASFTF
jgi:hypothetical protein